MGTGDGLVVLAGLPGSHHAANGQCRHSNPGGAGRFPRSRAWCFRLADGALHRGCCRLGTGSRQRGRARALTWRPGGRGCGISCRSSIATRTHGCGGMGPGRSGRPRWSGGTVGARTEGIQRSRADRPGTRMPWSTAGCDAAPQVPRPALWLSRQRFGVRVPGGAPSRPAGEPAMTAGPGGGRLARARIRPASLRKSEARSPGASATRPSAASVRAVTAARTGPPCRPRPGCPRRWARGCSTGTAGSRRCGCR
jgi:hypothetical protein